MFIFFNILFIHERERQGHRQRKKQAPCRKPDLGLNPGSPGSGPGLKVALNRWATRAVRHAVFMILSYLPILPIEYSQSTWNYLGFLESTMTFYTFLLYTCHSYCQENSYLYIRTHCKYHLLCDLLWNCGSILCAPEIFWIQLWCKMYIRYLMTCLYIFFPTLLREPQGQDNVHPPA